MWGGGESGRERDRRRDGGGETYQVSGILFDGSLEYNQNPNHEVPQFRPTPFQVTPIWTDPSSTGLDLYIKPVEWLHVSKLYNCWCWLWDGQSGLAAKGTSL